MQTASAIKESLLSFPERNLLICSLPILSKDKDILLFGLLPAGTLWTEHFLIKKILSLL
jgi:hypothetical protein